MKSFRVLSLAAALSLFGGAQQANQVIATASSQAVVPHLIRFAGQAEPPRVLLVSVPYAMKAGEADTLAGHGPADFVTTDKLSSAVQQELQQQSTASPIPGTGKKSAIKPSTPTDPATNFIDNNTSQVVLVQQNGAGSGLTATATTGIAVNAKSTGIAIYGNSTGTGTSAGVTARFRSEPGPGNAHNPATPGLLAIWGFLASYLSSEAFRSTIQRRRLHREEIEAMRHGTPDDHMGSSDCGSDGDRPGMDSATF